MNIKKNQRIVVMAMLLTLCTVLGVCAFAASIAAPVAEAPGITPDLSYTVSAVEPANTPNPAIVYDANAFTLQDIERVVFYDLSEEALYPSISDEVKTVKTAEMTVETISDDEVTLDSGIGTTCTVPLSEFKEDVTEGDTVLVFFLLSK